MIGATATVVGGPETRPISPPATALERRRRAGYQHAGTGPIELKPVDALRVALSRAKLNRGRSDLLTATNPHSCSRTFRGEHRCTLALEKCGPPVEFALLRVDKLPEIVAG
jgi:hypothetical protein